MKGFQLWITCGSETTEAILGYPYGIGDDKDIKPGSAGLLYKE